MTLRPDPAKIIVPRRHGEVLIEPPLRELESVVRASRPPLDRGKSATSAGNLPFEQPLDQLQVTARQHLLAAATQWSVQIGAPLPPPDAPNRPILLTGHQVEFYHSGVWAKVIAADALAKRCNATAFDLLVDHDTVDHQGFAVPVQSAAGDWSRQQIDFAAASPLPADALDAPTREQFEAWDAALAEHPQTHTDTMAFWLAALHPAHFRESKIAYVPWLSRTRRRFEASLNLHVHHVPTSLLCTGPLWQQFVTAWIHNAPAWTAAYNRHLDAYRVEQGIKNPSRPMPNLAASPGREGATYELPFWIYASGTPRERLTLQMTENGAKILHHGERLDLSWVLGHSSLVIRPRALTLTLYARLFFADLFLHGIGGAIYDQITDRLLADLFGTVPPYACVSAAWLLPLGPPGDSEDIPALTHRRHHLSHNPQLAIDPFTALKTGVAERITERKQIIADLAASVLFSRRNREEKLRRRQIFKRLHALNAQLHAHAPRILQRLDDQLAAATRAAAQNQTLLHREFFLGLHTTAALETLIARIRE